MEEKIDKRTKEYRDSIVDYGKIENNPGFRLCMICGQDKLPLGEDGQVRNRRVPEPCIDCVNAKLNKQMVDGREVDIPGGYGSKFIESVRSGGE